MKKITSILLFAVGLALCSALFALDQKPMAKTEHVMFSGTCSFGMGPKYDEAAAKDQPAGAFVVLPAGMQHFAGTKAGCVVQVQSIGPFQVVYVNPADDPRGAKK